MTETLRTLGFTQRQTDMLRALPDKLITSRRGPKGPVRYMPAWAAIDLANAIFGEGNWGFTFTDHRILREETYDKVVDGRKEAYFRVTAFAMSRVTVTTPDGHQVTREAPGISDAECPVASNPRTAFELAMSKACSKATNAALAKFGPAFGLLLRDEKDLAKHRLTATTPPVPALSAAPAPATITPAHTHPPSATPPPSPAAGSETSTATTPSAGTAAHAASAVAAETPEERTARMTTLAESVKQHIFATTDLAAHAEVMRAIAADIRQVTDYKAEWGARLTTYANSHEANLRILSAVQRQVAAAQDDPGLKTILRLQEQNLARLASEPALHELAQQAIAEAERRTRPAAA